MTTHFDWHAHAPEPLGRFSWFFSPNDAAWRVEVPFWIYFRLIHIKCSKLDQNRFAHFDWHAHAPKLLNRFSWIMHHSTCLGLKRCRFVFLRLDQHKWTKLVQTHQKSWLARPCSETTEPISWIMHYSTRLGLKRCRFEFYCDWALRRPTRG